MGHRINKITVLIIFCLTNLMTGCLSIDNQSYLPEEWKSFFNATPIVTSGLAVNQQHKIIIAIIDSGVDYNHPLLKDHIHYSLDGENKIVGVGWDYLGNDPWPLPYLARTKKFYNFAPTVIESDDKMREKIQGLIDAEPRLSLWLNIHRHHSQEDLQSIFHGTHVAGLASYDDSRIGLLPFRVLPVQESKENLSESELAAQVFENLNEAIIQAQKAGAKVVNLSLGTTFDVAESEAGGSLLRHFHNFENLVRQHPDLIFVAAAGNDGQWSDGVSRFNFPCGINAENMICVASLNSKGQPSVFTNIPFVKTPLVFASGEEILSTKPTRLCGSKGMNDLSFDIAPNDYQEKARKIYEECSRDVKSLMTSSGTSMASPIVARLVAQEYLRLGLDQPAARVIESFLKRGEKGSLGPMPTVKIHAPVPSWYASDTENTIWSRARHKKRQHEFTFTAVAVPSN